jgi:ElaB/YqjD/DUF883 family membrane-anchored ribosome-binding protein
MSTDPEQIRADIERTRTHLSDDVDALADEANPKKIAQRKTAQAKDAISGAKDRVMGKASDASGSAGERLSQAASDVQDKTSGAGRAVREQAEGNPLAAGLVAFGVGLLASSLFRSSKAEQQVAATAKEKLQPLAEEARHVAMDAADDLKGAAQEAAGSVRDTAAQGAQEVKDTGVSAAHDVRDQASESKDAVQQSRQS